MKKCIYKGTLKSVYVDKDKAEKVFALSYSKSDVLYEALNTARVEDTGLDIPRLLNVSVIDGKWTITSEYAKGETLKELLAKHPENADAYIEAMVDYQIAINKHSNPLLVDMKSKLSDRLMSLIFLLIPNMSLTQDFQSFLIILSYATVIIVQKILSYRLMTTTR